MRPGNQAVSPRRALGLYLSDFQAAVLRAWETGNARQLAALADYRRSSRN